MIFRRIVLITSFVLMGILSTSPVEVFANSLHHRVGSQQNLRMSNRSFVQGEGMQGGYGMMGEGKGNSSTQQNTKSGTQTSNVKTPLLKKGSYQVVRVVASDWKWRLSRHQFTLGKPIEFIVSSREGTHGFSISGTSISVAVSSGNRAKTVIWKPKKKGTYSIVCDIYCGPGHGSMIAKLKVV